MKPSNPELKGKYLARTLYDGSGTQARHDILIEIENGIFTRIAPYQSSDSASDIEEHAIITPGLIDIQINGANDVQFNSDITQIAIAKIAEGAAKGGAVWILPTFVTSDGSDYIRAINATRKAIESGSPGILGLHLEGPFLSPHRPGIHPREAIRPLTDTDIENLTEPFPGQLLVTLAPEEQSSGMIKKLTEAGVIVFAGHSEATFEDIEAAKSEGLRGATHLFNAMSQMQGREPGVVGSVLGGGLFAGIIADGYHVHWNNLSIAVKAIPDRLCLVTDAMCTVAGTITEFDFFNEHIFLKDRRLSNSQGTLAGAHLAMDESIRNLIDHCAASPEEAVKMASWNPARSIGLGDRLGLVEENRSANLALFDEGFRSIGVIR